jgi:hypothetical protein
MFLTHDGSYNMWWRLEGRPDHMLRYVPGLRSVDGYDDDDFMDSFPPNRLDVESWETGWEVGLCVVVDY